MLWLARCVDLVIMASGIVIEVQQHRLDFPAGNILFVPAFFHLLLSLQPSQKVAIRVTHLCFVLVCALLQLGHFKYWREIPPMCESKHVLVCVGNTGHVVVAHVYGVFFLCLLWPVCAQLSGDESLRRLWQYSRLIITCLCINLFWPPVLTLCSSLGQGLFAPDATFGFKSDFGPVYGPVIHDLTIVLTVSFWFVLVMVVAPERRPACRELCALPPLYVEEKDKVNSML
uniref:Uncharacterized protein n=1 Tax=Chrysotila carterae TaxID=13221 RepID=A0A7S4C5J2_CHRCT|mmetsp:Transcript_22905/g.50080  ORF Transcript_22905/g.50080 Transcript_22905/m.50080 type:complete len:229 (+) Transcript_22905:164-850(+)